MCISLQHPSYLVHVEWSSQSVLYQDTKAQASATQCKGLQGFHHKVRCLKEKNPNMSAIQTKPVNKTSTGVKVMWVKTCPLGMEGDSPVRCLVSTWSWYQLTRPPWTTSPPTTENRDGGAWYGDSRSLWGRCGDGSSRCFWSEAGRKTPLPWVTRICERENSRRCLKLSIFELRTNEVSIEWIALISSSSKRLLFLYK